MIEPDPSAQGSLWLLRAVRGLVRSRLDSIRARGLDRIGPVNRHIEPLLAGLTAPLAEALARQPSSTPAALRRVFAASLRAAVPPLIEDFDTLPYWQREKLEAFASRLLTIVEAHLRSAQDSTPPFDTVLCEAILERVVAALPDPDGGLSASQAACRALTDAFCDVLRAHASARFPTPVTKLLDRVDPDGISTFGARVLDNVVEELARGAHAEAARAFERSAGTAIRKAIGAIRHELAAGGAASALARAELDLIASRFDRISREVARGEADDARAAMLTRRIDAHLRPAGKLGRGGAILSTPEPR